MVADYAERFAEALKMNDLTLAQKLYWLDDIRIIDELEDVVISRSCFLFWGDPVSTTYTKI